MSFPTATRYEGHSTKQEVFVIFSKGRGLRSQPENQVHCIILNHLNILFFMRSLLVHMDLIKPYR